MKRRETTEVLVVGAGPVGLMSALLLAEQGVRVKIIDREEGVAAHGYVCALHRRALKSLDRVGLAGELMALGQPVDTVAFYEGARRRAQIQVRSGPGELPYVLTLRQRTLESVLEQALVRRTHLPVQWGHRLAGLQPQGDHVVAEVHELEMTSKGYSVPHLDQVVRRARQVEAAFVVGADGYGSLVRQMAGIESQATGGSSVFAFFDFEHQGTLPKEVRVVLDAALTSCLWPLPEQAGRWAFQLDETSAFDPGEHRLKDRDAVLLEDAQDPNSAPGLLARLIQERAPWFDVPIRDLVWHRTVRFEHRLVKEFGRGRCWLAGGAAHQACPVGMQSVNVGLAEATQLSDILVAVLRQGAPMTRLEEYQRSRQEEWQQLLGLTGEPKLRPQADPWVRQRRERFVPCLPASREDLEPMIEQLALDLAATN